MAGARRTAFTLVAGLTALVVVVRLAPAVKRMLVLGDRVRGSPVRDLKGRGFALTLPPDLWYVARQRRFELTDGGDPTDPGRPVLEQRLLRADGRAHLAVVSWRLPGGGSLDLDAAAARVSDGSSRKLAKWRLLDVTPLPGRGGTRVLHATAWLEDRDVELLWGLYPNGQALVGVVLAADRGAFENLRKELDGILASFRTTQLAPPG